MKSSTPTGYLSRAEQTSRCDRCGRAIPRGVWMAVVFRSYFRVPDHYHEGCWTGPTSIESEK